MVRGRIFLGESVEGRWNGGKGKEGGHTVRDVEVTVERVVGEVVVGVVLVGIVLVVVILDEVGVVEVVVIGQGAKSVEMGVLVTNEDTEVTGTNWVVVLQRIRVFVSNSEKNIYDATKNQEKEGGSRSCGTTKSREEVELTR